MLSSAKSLHSSCAYRLIHHSIFVESMPTHSQTLSSPWKRPPSLLFLCKHNKDVCWPQRLISWSKVAASTNTQARWGALIKLVLNMLAAVQAHLRCRTRYFARERKKSLPGPTTIPKFTTFCLHGRCLDPQGR